MNPIRFSIEAGIGLVYRKTKAASVKAAIASTIVSWRPTLNSIAYEDDFHNFIDYKARMILLLITEGHKDRAIARLEALRQEYSDKHYEAVRAKVAELLR